MGRYAMAISLLLLVSSFNGLAAEKCSRLVSDNEHIKINVEEERQLAKIGMGRKQILESLRITSIPESNGCWSSSSGNFDGQLLSVGVAQWNFGQNSLQPLLNRFKASYTDDALFKYELNKIMPSYGRKFFSLSCLRTNVGSECVEFIKNMQGSKGTLNQDFKKEVDALFSTDLMTQIQADVYMKLLGRVASDLSRIFPNTPTPLQIKWAIDTKVQQGQFPSDLDLKRVRDKLSNFTKEQTHDHLVGILKWYEGLCLTVDQDGVKTDFKYNVKKWTEIVDNYKIDKVKAELLTFSYLRSRTATGKGGLYQADTFQRRARIIFCVGSVHGSLSSDKDCEQEGDAL